MKLKKNLSREEIYIVILFTFIISIVAGFIGYQFGNSNFRIDTNNKTLGKADLLSTHAIITNYYHGDFSKSLILQGGIEGMVKNLKDTNSFYLSSNDYSDLKNEESGKRYGLGFQYTLTDSIMTIVDMSPNSPMQKAGIPIYSRILAINAKAISDLNSPKEAAELFSKLDTFTFSVLLKNNEEKTYKIKKAYYTIPVIRYKKINNKYSYLKIYSFSHLLEEEYVSIISNLKKDIPQALIIDLRDNLGGETTQAVNFADLFLEKGTIVTENYKDEKSNKIYSAKPGTVFPLMKIVLLVNKETSSAAEIFAAAIKDNKRGVILGEKTYGKDAIGRIFPFSDGSAINLTIGRWLTPQNKSVKGVGIKPDQEIVDDISTEIDEVLEKAITR